MYGDAQQTPSSLSVKIRIGLMEVVLQEAISEWNEGCQSMAVQLVFNESLAGMNNGLVVDIVLSWECGLVHDLITAHFICAKAQCQHLRCSSSHSRVHRMAWKAREI